MRAIARPPLLLRQVYAGALWRVKTTEKKIYLTFDDGPVPGITPAALSVLKEHDVKATFFCVGENVRRYPEIFLQVQHDGHATGNHTFRHSDGWNMKTRNYLREVQQCAEVVKSSLFRPPYGRMRNSQFKAIRRKYNVVMWDVLTCDFDPGITAEEVLALSLQLSREGSVVVFHDSEKAGEKMLRVLPEYLREMKSRGFEFATL